MKIIAIEEHWNSAGIRDTLDRLPTGVRRNRRLQHHGRHQARLEDTGQGRVEAMDAGSRRRNGPGAGREPPAGHPAHDDLFATPARLHQPIFIHPHDPTNPAADR